MYMPFKIDPVALVLDVFTFGCYSSYLNIQRITKPNGRYATRGGEHSSGDSTPRGHMLETNVDILFVPVF